MKIAIDISQIVYETGTSRYTKSLVESLLTIDRNNEYILFGGALRRTKELQGFAVSLRGNFKSKIFPLPPTLSDFLGNVLHFPNVEFFTGKIDVYHSSDWVQYPTNAFKVTTVHDLAPILYPEFTAPSVVNVHKRRLKHVQREADRIIVPTESVKGDLVMHGFEEDKITVIGEGVGDVQQATKEEILSIRKKYTKDKNYLLAVGVGKRKNTEGIIKAFKKLGDENLRLVIVGHKYIEMAPFPGVVFTGHVENSELSKLYSGASALVYPSIYEGFGLPILEAFSTETPVVTSNRGAMKEVAGGAAVLVDPDSVESIAGGIKKAMKNNVSLVKKGRSQVKKYSWGEAARQTLKVYESAKLAQ